LIQNELSGAWKAIVEGTVIKDGRQWTLPDSSKWPGDVLKFHDRLCYDTNIATIGKRKKVLISGTAGIGKTMFLIRLLDHIVETSPGRTLNTSVVYVDEEAGTTLRYRLLADGSMTHYDPLKHQVPDYLLSDSVDLQNAKSTKLSLMVASEKKAKCVFQKRVNEANSDGSNITMPPFTQSELVSIKPPEMSDEEAVFRADVFGGSGRNFNTMEVTNSDPLPIVEGVMAEFFTLDYKVRFSNSWQNILEVVSNKLKNLTDGADSREIVNSMFRHCTAGNSKIWASPFMKGLAAAVEHDSDDTITSALKGILGKSGYGSLFESVGHLKLIRCETEYNLYPLLPLKSEASQDSVKFSAFRMQTIVIREVTDICKLDNGTYGLPLFDNFPLVDAIIQPNTLIQYTVATTDHKGAIDQLDRIRDQLVDKDRANHRMIFVVSRYNFKTFKYQKDLSDIRQYITTDVPLVQKTTDVPLVQKTKIRALPLAEANVGETDKKVPKMKEIWR
jgi:hypothetical protein